MPYDCTIKVTNRFKELDLIDRVPEELWTEVPNIVQETVIKTIPKKTEILQKGKMVIWGGLKNSWEKEEKWKAKEKRKDIPIWMQSSKEQQGETRKPSLPWSMQRNK